MKKQKIHYARKNPKNRFEHWIQENFGNQVSLAKELRVNPRTVSLWVNGYVIPASKYIYKIWEMSQDEFSPNYWFFELPLENKQKGCAPCDR